jgi:FtsP/CotA-like multicopper oxidase with cupredoxin domain/cation diffusion facilitator CzcD-associated flavoprotein CzcO
MSVVARGRKVKNGARAERREVVVIGGGQAGLALGYFLSHQGRAFTIFEAGADPAAAWRQRWESLRLFTSARYNALPGVPFPGDPDRYPGRDEVVEYLTDYARRFELPVELGSRVRSLSKTDGTYLVALDDRTYAADQVVVATGPFQVPFVPALAERLDERVLQLHSSYYRSPGAVSEGPVLVVGGGNSGFQIAEELSRTHEVHMSIGSRQTPLPQRLLGRDLFWWLDRSGLIRTSVESRIGQRLAGRDTLIGARPATRARRYGLRLHGRAVDATGITVRFDDGSGLDVGSVIWATGFRSDYSWIDAPVFDERGRLLHRRGVTASPGLYFLGLTWQHTRGSALLGFVKDDAEHIAQQIAAFQPAAADHRERSPAHQKDVYQHRPEAPAASNRRTRMSTPADHFPTTTAGLPEARPPEVVELSDGERFELRIAPVAKRLGDVTVRMLAYNGSIPGPVLKVARGSEIVVEVVNQGDMEATVHWHGLRLENRYDGTHETQPPIAVGGRFTARVEFADPGVYWYHPHIREDYGQEMGLYGNILVEPADPRYWPPADRELLLTLDDVLLEDGRIAPFSRAETTYAAMGRFGNLLLVNGETELSLDAQLGEVVRLYLTNTANTRVFKVALPGAQMKLVGGDSGHVEREQLVEEVILAPSERAVVDVLFELSGTLTLEHRTPGRTYPLAGIRVEHSERASSAGAAFDVLRTNADLVAERERLGPYLEADPDKTLALIAEMDLGTPEGPVVYSCPMHPEVLSEEPGSCPQCGMKLLATATTYTCPMHPEILSDEPGKCPQCGMKLLPSQIVAEAGGGHGHGGQGTDAHDHPEAHGAHEGHSHGGHGHATAEGIEWEDDMVEVNRLTTATNMRWKLIDRQTGAENAAIDWRFRVGDRVKIRLLNEMAGDHPMHHPFHVHGAGRFLVLARDGAVEANLVWKDTVLVRAGETVDILLDVTNPGRWMAHCHIAEHHESGMMFSFDVAPA